VNKNTKYQGLLTEILDEIRQKRGDGEAQRIFAECKAEGQEAMSREAVLLIVARHLPRGKKIRFFTAHPFLIFPVLMRFFKPKPDTSG